MGKFIVWFYYLCILMIWYCLVKKKYFYYSGSFYKVVNDKWLFVDFFYKKECIRNVYSFDIRKVLGILLIKWVNVVLYFDD